MNNYFTLIHRDDSAFVSLLTKCTDDSFIRELVPVSELDLIDASKIDFYASINNFSTNWTGSQYNIRDLNACFIDFDYYKIERFKMASAEQFIELVEFEMSERYFGWARPSLWVDSGRGVYAIWLLEQHHTSQFSKMLFKSVQRGLYETFKDFGADVQALDVSRVLRVPGSINGRNMKTVRIIEQNDNIYNLLELELEFDIKIARKPQKRILAQKATQKTKKAPHEAKKGIKTHKSIYSLNQKRANDIKKLILMRNKQMKGMRNVALWLWALHANYAFFEELEAEAYSLFPTLKKSEIKQVLRNAERALERKIRNDEIYKYKNETIIELLDISNVEQQELETIISLNEKYRRNNERRNSNRKKISETKKADKSAKIKKAHKLRASGFDIQSIGKKLNISERTVRSYLKTSI